MVSSAVAIADDAAKADVQQQERIGVRVVGGRHVRMTIRDEPGLRPHDGAPSRRVDREAMFVVEPRPIIAQTG
jgi:hypothetical protein